MVMMRTSFQSLTDFQKINKNNLRVSPYGKLTDSLEHYWRLEEASGDRMDSVSTSDLSDNNTVTQVAGKHGNAGEFLNASNNFLSTTQISTLNPFNSTEWSLSCWFNVGSTERNHYLVTIWDTGSTTGRAFYLLYDGAGPSYSTEIRTYDGGSEDALTVSGELADDTWHHVVIVKGVGMYINNVFTSGAWSGGRSTSLDLLVGGAYASATKANNSSCSIDEVGIWSRTLTADDVSLLYSSGDGIAYPFPA